MRIKIFNSIIEISFRVSVIHELYYSGGKDFKKAVRFAKKVARKKHCKCGLYLYTKDFLNAPVSMSNKEKIYNGWMLTWPFAVDKDDNESIIMVTLDSKTIKGAFEIAPGEYMRMYKKDGEYILQDRINA